ncbi:unnamed protein product, partial [Closterium sp. NIES-54]
CSRYLTVLTALTALSTRIHSPPPFPQQVKLRSEYAGVLALVVPQVQQVFDRVDCSAITAAAEARFQFFVSTIFPRLRDSVQGGVLVYTQSYFEFVRLRNFFKQENLSFCLLSEYTDERNVHRARAWFFQNRRRIMLYSERSHFYHRYRIRGIREVIFYSLPCYPHFYAEILNLLEGVDNASCSAIFTRFDNLELARIVGSSRSTRMLQSPNHTFMFC